MILQAKLCIMIPTTLLKSPSVVYLPLNHPFMHCKEIDSNENVEPVQPGPESKSLPELNRQQIDTFQQDIIKASGGTCIPEHTGTTRHLKHKESKSEYADVAELKNFLNQLKGKKFILDCGHKVTFGTFLGNDITIRNGKNLKIICSQCGY